MNRYLRLLLFTLLMTALFYGICACGSDAGGDGGDLGPANVSISLSPHLIDTGDRTTATIRLGSLQEAAVALKVRFPSGLSYVDESGSVLIGEDSFQLVPDDGGTSGQNSFAVFYFRRSELGPQGAAQVSFELEGVSNVQDGLVGVDVDIDNPDISNVTEFSIDDPKFDPLDEDTIEVGRTTTPSSSGSSSGSSSSGGSRG